MVLIFDSTWSYLAADRSDRLREGANDRDLDFQCQLRVYLDCGQHLVSACYLLEGDGPLILKGFDLLNTVEVNLRSQGAAVGHRTSAYLAARTSDANKATAAAKMRLALAPAHAYLVSKIAAFTQSMAVMKAARYWDPARLVALHRDGEQTAASIDAIIIDIQVLKWLTPLQIAALKSEFLSYYACARDFNPGRDEAKAFVAFFSHPDHSSKFPTFCEQYFNVILLQTSEGTVERSFSDFKNIQQSNQESRMEETLCAATMARYNARDDAL